jgi:hypothetical protein
VPLREVELWSCKALGLSALSSWLLRLYSLHRELSMCTILCGHCSQGGGLRLLQLNLGLPGVHELAAPKAWTMMIGDVVCSLSLDSQSSWTRPKAWTQAYPYI